MAFTIGSLANNAMQLQMQQMLGNLANGMNAAAAAAVNSMTLPSQQQQHSHSVHSQSLLSSNNGAGGGGGGSNIENKQVIPMDLETDGPNTTKPTENMFINLGLPSSSFPIIHTGMIDPTLLNMQMMQQIQNHVGQSASVSNNVVAGPSSGTVMSAATVDTGVLHFKSCALHPPAPGTKPSTRQKPNGCRTVFVGGLPDNMTETILHEIFETCGEITTLRLSKKNFCHIRFVTENSVDTAIGLSGYRVRIGNSTESPNCGRLHVDYAQARDDQYDYECKLRQLQREQRHRDKVVKDRVSSSVSPPKTIHFSENEATTLTERIKNDDTMSKACQTLINWLERGDCNKKNSNTLYTLIQSVNSQIRRLFTDKLTYEEELQEAKDRHKRQIQCFKVNLNQIQKVFNSASHQKVWDHFTKAQRKNIDGWKKALENKIEEEDDAVMEISDDEYHYSPKRPRIETDKLKEENDSLRCQLRACRAEVYQLRCEGKGDYETKEKQINVLQETIRNMQTQLLANKAREQEDTKKITTLEERLKKAHVKELLMKTKIAEASRPTKDSFSGKESEIDESEVIEHKILSDNEDEVQIIETAKSPDVIIASDDEVEIKTVQSPIVQLTDVKAKIISLSTAFLLIHPSGAPFDKIFIYIKQSIASLTEDELRDTLRQCDVIFSQQLLEEQFQQQLQEENIVNNSENGDNSIITTTTTTATATIINKKEIWKFIGFFSPEQKFCDDVKEVYKKKNS